MPGGGHVALDGGHGRGHYWKPVGERRVSDQPRIIIATDIGRCIVYRFIVVCLLSQTSQQERPDCPQQLVDLYRLCDIGCASTLQSRGFVSRRRKRGYRNDRNGLGPIVLFEHAGHVEPADVRQSYIHQDQIRLFIASKVDRFEPL